MIFDSMSALFTQIDCKKTLYDAIRASHNVKYYSIAKDRHNFVIKTKEGKSLATSINFDTKQQTVEVYLKFLKRVRDGKFDGKFSTK